VRCKGKEKKCPPLLLEGEKKQQLHGGKREGKELTYVINSQGLGRAKGRDKNTELNKKQEKRASLKAKKVRTRCCFKEKFLMGEKMRGLGERRDHQIPPIVCSRETRRKRKYHFPPRRLQRKGNHVSWEIERKRKAGAWAPPKKAAFASLGENVEVGRSREDLERPVLEKGKYVPF